MISICFLSGFFVDQGCLHHNEKSHGKIAFNYPPCLQENRKIEIETEENKRSYKMKIVIITDELTTASLGTIILK